MSSACVAPTVVMMLFRRGMHAQGRQLVGKRAAQAAVAHGFAVLQRELLQRPGAGHLAHRRGHESRFHPVGREHAHAGLGLVADLVEHAADQRRRFDRRIDAAPPIPSRSPRPRPAGRHCPARAPPAQARRGSRARRSRGSCALPPCLAPAAGHTRPPPSTGSRPAAARIAAPRAGERRAPAIGRGYAGRSEPTAARSAIGKRLSSAWAASCVLPA